MALGFIGLSAGGHFQVSEMAASIGPAFIILACLVFLTFGGTLLSIMTLGRYIIPFFAALNSSQELAVSLLVACLSVARSPSSAIAIISELNAKGPFTTVVLAVTVMMDVVVVVLFSITLMVARALDDPSAFLQPTSTDGDLVSDGGDASQAGTSFVRQIAKIVLVEFSQKVLLSAFAGFLLGLSLPLIFGWEPARPSWPVGRVTSIASVAAAACTALALVVRGVVVLLQRASLPITGWLLFFEEEMAAELDLSDWLNPLICTMVAGFTIVNYTNAGKPFHEAVDSLSGPIYLLFFLYTGVSMDVGVLARNLPACLLVFVTRAALIVLSTYLGGTFAKQPDEFRCRYWMSFLTQAGVTLGLAKDASAHFVWGPDFNATIVAVSVINQIVGPPLMKYALRAAGEARHNYVPGKLKDVSGMGSIGAIGKANLPLTGRPQPRGCLVIAEDALRGDHGSDRAPGLDVGESEAHVVASRLRARGWEVMLADEKLAVTGAEAADRQRMDKTARALINRLPAKVRSEVSGYMSHSAKPWDRVHATRSLPNLSASIRKRPGGSSGDFSTDYIHTLPRAGDDLEGGSRATEVAALLKDLGGSGLVDVNAASLGESSTTGRDGSRQQRDSSSLSPIWGARQRDGSRGSPVLQNERSSSSGQRLRRSFEEGDEARDSSPILQNQRSSSSRRRRRSFEEGEEARAASPSTAESPTGRSSPALRRSRRLSHSRQQLPRSRSFGKATSRSSFAELLAPPSVPQMPEDPDEDPVRYAQCMRLLWLAASMKSFDVVVCLLATDDANVDMCELISDMVPMLQFTRKLDPQPPQVLVTLTGSDADNRKLLEGIRPMPLVLPRRTAMPSLVCEVLHPDAHWTGALDRWAGQRGVWEDGGGGDGGADDGADGGADGGGHAEGQDGFDKDDAPRGGANDTSPMHTRPGSPRGYKPGAWAFSPTPTRRGQHPSGLSRGRNPTGSGARAPQLQRSAQSTPNSGMAVPNLL